MSKWVAVSKEKHLNAGWVAPSGYAHATAKNMAPLVSAELDHAIAHYPVAFTRNEEGKFKLYALLSLENNTNLFTTTSGKWMVPYVPAAFRSYPFNMSEKLSGGYVLVVDEEANCFHEHRQSDDLTLLNDDGQPSEMMEPMLQFMSQRIAMQNETDSLIQSLADYGLIEEWPIDLQFGSEENIKRIKGLYCINEAALKALPDSVLKELSVSGALTIAYAHIFSRPRLKELQARYVQFVRQTRPSVPTNIDLNEVFGEESESDLFSF